MKKLSTLFQKDPEDLGRVINKVDPKNRWVLNGFGIATRKYDGTACAIIDSVLYRRYDAKKNKKGVWKPIPEGAIPCQEADETSGHHPHWVRCDRNNPADKYHFEAFDIGVHSDGTYELCGEKINGNPEEIEGHILIRHGVDLLYGVPLDFEGIKNYLEKCPYEGIVYHHSSDDKMCKIRKGDFGFKR